MPLYRTVCAAALAWLVVSASMSPLDAQTTADLFDDTQLQDIRLLIHSKDLAQLRANFNLNTYHVADLVWKNQRVRNVGIRSRGTGSRNGNKMGLLVDFDRYTTNQKFLGLDTLVLDNVYQDASLMREFLAMKLYRRMGMVAPREAFARLYINNEYQGLYAVVEAIDPGFVTRTFGATDGYLYEFHAQSGYYLGDLGDSLDAYDERFEAQSHLLESDIQLYGPIRDLIREINGPDDAVWLDRVGARLDLVQFMTHVGVQGCTSQNDGVLGFDGANNFYLYRPAASAQHRLLPWDEDFAFEAPEGFPITRKSDSGEVVLFTRAWAQPELRTVFFDVNEACAHAIGDDNWMLNEVNRVADLIRSSVFEDQRKQFSNDEFTARVDELIQFATTRMERVLAEVASLR